MGMTITPAIGKDLETCLRIIVEDGHGVPNPTHLVSFEGEPLGCFSIAPALAFSMRKDKALAIHSYKAFKEAVSMISRKGIIPIVFSTKDSPFKPFFPKLGFDQIKGAEVYMSWDS